MRPARVLVVALAFALPACSDDDPDATPSTTSKSATTEAIALRGDGLGVVDLGSPPDAAVAAVTAELGEPSADTGWESSFESYGTCPGEQIRGVEWGGLVLLFTDGDTDHGRGEHLFTWRVSDAPPALATARGLGYGATAADAEELYPGRVEAFPAEEPFPALLEIDAEGGPITAYLDDQDSITNLEAGATCGE